MKTPSNLVGHDFLCSDKLGARKSNLQNPSFSTANTGTGHECGIFKRVGESFQIHLLVRSDSPAQPVEKFGYKIRVGLTQYHPRSICVCPTKNGEGFIQSAIISAARTLWSQVHETTGQATTAAELLPTTSNFVRRPPPPNASSLRQCATAPAGITPRKKVTRKCKIVQTTNRRMRGAVLVGILGAAAENRFSYPFRCQTGRFLLSLPLQDNKAWGSCPSKSSRRLRSSPFPRYFSGRTFFRKSPMLSSSPGLAVVDEW